MSTQAAVFGTLLVLLSTTAGGTVIGGAQAEVVTIDECQTISAGGEYRLGQNISNEGREACMQVTASDVSIDGAGYTIDGPAQGAAILVEGEGTLTDVTIENLSVQRRSGGIQLHGVDGGAVQDLTLKHGDVTGAIYLDNTTDVTVGNNDISHSMFGIVLNNADENTVVGNDFSENHLAQETLVVDDSSDNDIKNNVFVEGTVDVRPDAPGNTIVGNTFRTDGRIYQSTAFLIRSDNNVVADNSIKNVETGIAVTGSNNNVHDNHIIGATEFAITASATGQTIEENTLVGSGEGIDMAGGGIQLNGGDHVVMRNILTDNVHGIEVRSVSDSMTIERNRFASNNIGIEIHETALCGAGGEGAELVEIHENDLVNSHAYGVVNHDSDVVDATNNYWGSSDGVSSHESAAGTVVDPVSGTEADGSGDAVSARRGTNTASVQFDGWLDSPVFEATADA
ncbi:right-handed parallel beta-helix repeat-containing protein [Haladaptatus sp. ZSTT2]|uniref:right-handed parallel beta-helix repeat-containing protein n=1 Tax=Haladaptatus sp. ZSTT2 TaxID=3120515 RepID=UPI00300F110C